MKIGSKIIKNRLCNLQINEEIQSQLVNIFLLKITFTSSIGNLSRRDNLQLWSCIASSGRRQARGARWSSVWAGRGPAARICPTRGIDLACGYFELGMQSTTTTLTAGYSGATSTFVSLNFYI